MPLRYAFHIYDELIYADADMMMARHYAAAAMMLRASARYAYCWHFDARAAAALPLR